MLSDSCRREEEREFHAPELIDFLGATTLTDNHPPHQWKWPSLQAENNSARVAFQG